MSSDVTSQHVADSDTIEPDTITNVKQTSSGFVIRQYVVLSTVLSTSEYRIRESNDVITGFDDVRAWRRRS